MKNPYPTSAPTEVNEFKKDLISYFQNQATGQRASAAIGNTKHNYDRHSAKAETYDMMVKFLQGLEVR